VTLRRADEMGDAITARGGIGQISAAPPRPKLADWLALSTIAAVCVASILLDVPLPGHH
jgi:energy-coupling factor transport system permease protein